MNVQAAAPTNALETGAKILVVDDEAAARGALAELLGDEQYEVRTAADGFKALGVLGEWSPDLILTDLRMPALDGMGLLVKARELVPDLPIVVMTAYGSIESAVAAMHEGADDYLAKPLNFDHVQEVVRRQLRRRRWAQESQRVRELVAAGEAGAEGAEQDGEDAGGLIGSSPAIARILRTLSQVAGGEAPVLLEGERGVELIALARRLHQEREDAGPLRFLHVETLSYEEQRSKLFGEGGLSDAGTLVLDGVASLDPRLQAELADRLEHSTLAKDSESFARLVSLNWLVEEGASGGTAPTLRPELRYQLEVLRIGVPPLRQRPTDISELAARTLMQLRRKRELRISGIHPRTLSLLQSYRWPGNVDELRRAMVHACEVAQGADIEPRDLPRELYRQRPEAAPPSIPGATLAEIERYAILRTLEEVGGSTSKAAKLLGISPRKIQYKVAEYRDQD